MTLLAGCFGPKPEEELYVAFENAAKQEKPVFKDAKKLETLEKQGQELYAQIVQEGKDNNQAVKEKLDQALKNTAERGKVIDKEKEALNEAQEEIKSVDKHVKKIEDNKLKQQAEKVQNAYEKRHDSFKKMYDVYSKSLKLEKELYTMLQDKDAKLKAISDKVKTVNQSYKDIDTEKDKFNEYTKSYNAEKVVFYKQANIKIKEEKK
ncbi:YkyA family protein [Bacillus sp. DX1.1]|uniref:YkyA family protein n=1 Tax=unclassified Bacillus (in: firmicutes) TaxID=185979 RepID=UPI00256FEF19|nr:MULTISPECIES: YkyA family protein [unclassified Bacillus (in: firmicutes)]MDM5156184.1 YkyA family protein [Bacillus sp. DX1.1]WJE84133.1 YkyA family protein [Bacillus sp. DX3.1]